MKKSISNLMVALVFLLSFTTSNAQLKNSKIETVKIYGNCGMCEKTIEKAGSIKKTAIVDWNKDTKMATLTYDSKKTNQDEILKRIALAGYDSDKFLAPDDVYATLHGCCQYDRESKTPVKEVKSETTISENHANHSSHDVAAEMTTQKENPLTPVFDNYFKLKDALISSDGTSAAAQSSALLSSINTVQMDKLEMDVHMVWMKVLENLKSETEMISKNKDVKMQRNHLNLLSQNIFSLMKVSKMETPTYYQFCPMFNSGKGANWISKESEIKNPYYGSMMLSCGKTVETIK
ncbi:DUF3347 domain-containing protein [Flavobacterium sp.]